MMKHCCNCGATGPIGCPVPLPVVKVYKSESGNVLRVRPFDNKGIQIRRKVHGVVDLSLWSHLSNFGRIVLMA